MANKKPKKMSVKTVWELTIKTILAISTLIFSIAQLLAEILKMLD